METVTLFIALASRDLPMVEYACSLKPAVSLCPYVTVPACLYALPFGVIKVGLFCVYPMSPCASKGNCDSPIVENMKRLQFAKEDIDWPKEK